MSASGTKRPVLLAVRSAMSESGHSLNIVSQLSYWMGQQVLIASWAAFFQLILKTGALSDEGISDTVCSVITPPSFW